MGFCSGQLPFTHCGLSWFGWPWAAMRIMIMSVWFIFFLILVNISISWFVYYSNFFLGEGCGAGRVGWPLFRWALFPYNIAECFFLVTKYCVVYNCFNYGGLWR